MKIKPAWARVINAALDLQEEHGRDFADFVGVGSRAVRRDMVERMISAGVAEREPSGRVVVTQAGREAVGRLAPSVPSNLTPEAVRALGRDAYWEARAMARVKALAARAGFTAGGGGWIHQEGYSAPFCRGWDTFAAYVASNPWLAERLVETPADRTARRAKEGVAPLKQDVQEGAKA